MRRRKTKCLSWGQTRRWSERVPSYSAIICYEEYVTLCGRVEDDFEWADSQPTSGKRPEGICPRCFAQYKRDMAQTPQEPLHSSLKETSSLEFSQGRSLMGRPER